MATLFTVICDNIPANLIGVMFLGQDGEWYMRMAETGEVLPVDIILDGGG